MVVNDVLCLGGMSETFLLFPRRQKTDCCPTWTRATYLSIDPNTHKNCRTWIARKADCTQEHHLFISMKHPHLPLCKTMRHT